MSGAMIITGGGRGIGAATAVLAAASGYAVAIGYERDERAAESVARGIRESGGRALAVQGEGSPQEVARAISWLASDAASYCTDAILDVSGGR